MIEQLHQHPCNCPPIMRSACGQRRDRGHVSLALILSLERLDALKDRLESGQINSVKFLKQLLAIAKETVLTEEEVPPE